MVVHVDTALPFGRFYAVFTACLLLAAGGLLSGCAASLPDPDQTISAGPLEERIAVAGMPGDQSIDHLLADRTDTPESLSHLKRLIRIDQAITGRPLFGGNSVNLLIDGPMTYDAMFAAMRNARHHIHIETFILDDEEVGQKLADILIERRKAGVEVRMVYDAFGILNAEDAYFERLRSHGIDLYKYHPLDPTENPRIWLINQRHHRKIVVIDGRIAFTGGINISGVYSHSSFIPPGDMSKLKERWRDTHLRLTGPVVAAFQRLFVTLWADLHDEAPLAGPAYFPPLPPTGDSLVRVMVSFAGDEEIEIYKVYLTVFSEARHRIWVTQGYFSPDQRFLDVLKDAARRGVDVRLLLPGATDSWITISSSRAHYAELLRAGVRIFERKDALQHAKTALVDDVWSTVGSTNLDYRSFLHANEVNAIIYGQPFAEEMAQVFRIDQTKNTEIVLNEWQQRSWTQRFKELLGSIIDYWL